MKGRRIPLTPDGKLPSEYQSWDKDGNPWRPGDYIGPVMGYTGDKPMVQFALPVTDSEGRVVLGHVCSPPHVFRECPDGSLEIRESILHTRRHMDFQWHGYLDEGHDWRTV